MTRDILPKSRVDLRGFSYELAPYLHKQEWQMERLEARLAKVQQAIAKHREALNAQQKLMQSGALHLQQLMQSRPDPSAHRQGMSYLSDVRSRISKLQDEIDELVVQRAQLQAECVAQQQSVDGLLEHRDTAMHQFALEHERLAASEADRDWISRSSARALVRSRDAESY